MVTATGGAQNAPITAAAGSGEQGATFSAILHRRALEGIPVTLDELEDFKNSGIEEFRQFALGEFIAAGALWLVVERAFTVEEFWKDTLFLVCAVALASGVGYGYFALKQLRRRKNRIDRIIEAARRERSSISGAS